nr:hypothetical protein [Tanacetum cinerariifolium]
MSSASSAVTYTSVYTDSELGRASYAAGSLTTTNYIPGPKEPQTPPVPQDKDEREPMFIQPHDPDYVPELMYPEYIPLEDKHMLLAEEQPLSPVVSPIAESPGYDEEEEDKEEEAEEEHLAPADSAVVIPTASIPLPPEAEVERLLAMPTPPPSPLTSLSPPSTEERLDSTFDVVTAVLPSPPLPPPPPPLYIPPPVDRKDDTPKTEMPPRKRSCLFALGPRYEVGESSIARPTGEAVPEIAPMTLGEVNTMVTELAELHEHDTPNLYALLEDAHNSRTQISQRVTSDSRQAQMVETLRVMGDMRREMGDMHAELLAQREQPQIMAPVTRQGPNIPPNNTNPNNMTPKSVQAMIDQALLRKSTNGDGSHSLHEDNERNVQTARPCFYADFMKC